MNFFQWYWASVLVPSFGERRPSESVGFRPLATAWTKVRREVALSGSPNSIGKVFSSGQAAPLRVSSRLFQYVGVVVLQCRFLFAVSRSARLQSSTGFAVPDELQSSVIRNWALRIVLPAIAWAPLTVRIRNIDR